MDSTFPKPRFVPQPTYLVGTQPAERHHPQAAIHDLADRTKRSALPHFVHDLLGETLHTHRYVPLRGLQITGARSTMKKGESLQLGCRIEPSNATRNNVIRVSSNPSIAGIDKFGLLTAQRKGEATVTVYSWDDALPVATGKGPDFRTGGIKDEITIQITP